LQHLSFVFLIKLIFVKRGFACFGDWRYRYTKPPTRLHQSVRPMTELRLCSAPVVNTQKGNLCIEPTVSATLTTLDKYIGNGPQQRNHFRIGSLPRLSIPVTAQCRTATRPTRCLSRDARSPSHLANSQLGIVLVRCRKFRTVMRTSSRAV